jgi:hypothetical protein
MITEKELPPGYRWLSWTLRFLLLAIALYIEIFAFDVFKSGFPFWKTVLAFVLHSVPSIALISVLLIALKWEQIAGFTLLCFALLGTLPAGPPNEKNHFIYFVLGAIVLIGILFVLNYFVLGNRKTGESL